MRPLVPITLGWVALGWLALAGGMATAAGAGPAGTAEDEPPDREAYIPQPEFHAYYDREKLAVEAVTLIRVKRPDHTEALVAKEESGWEHVVLDGFRLTFYNLARQPLRRMAGKHVIVQDWSGGAHCCFDYYVLHVSGVHVRREGMIRAGDCSLRVADLDGDGALELIACDSRFAYAFDLSFAESPLVPLIYTFRDKSYVADNRRFPQIFRYRIAQERRRLQEAQHAGDDRRARGVTLSLVLHLLYAGRVTEAWCTFDRTYRWADRGTVQQEVLAGLRKAADPDEPRLPIADLSYTLAPPGRCQP